MDTNPLLFSLRNASYLLKTADNELMRPEEDTVLLCGCHSTKNAVTEFLKIFLEENGVDNTSGSMENLMIRSRHLAPEFCDIDISCFDCKVDYEPGCYCLDQDKVRECYAKAKSIEKIVLANLDVAEEELSF
jgi:hypothetical protein